jgi:riboflavin kinase/FMN adenylyltransferase
VRRWRGLSAVPSGWGRCVATIGVFDGVHRGHQQIIGRARERADALGLPLVVVTFDPHPSEVVRPGSHPAMLTSPRYKAELMAGIGVDALCVLPFTQELSRLSAAEFVHNVLVEALHVRAVVVGENFRFGHRAAGDVATLRTLGGTFGFAAEGVSLFRDPVVDAVMSSTLARSLVAAGDMRAAAHVLGRDHRLEGVVVRGDARGRELGYPTANLEVGPHAAVPADGIYAGWLVRAGGAGERLPAAISIGTNPTFEGTERRVEAYCLDVTVELYGERVALDLHERLRDTEVYTSADALIAQIGRDVERTREVLAGAAGKDDQDADEDGGGAPAA